MFSGPSAADIPADAAIVAGFVDGAHPWMPADWARFPGAQLVRVARNYGTVLADVLDTELGGIPPFMAVTWAAIVQNVTGRQVGLYCHRRILPVMRRAFQQADVPLPWFWITADPADTQPPTDLPAGVAAVEYPAPLPTHGDYRMSLVVDHIHGFDQEKGLI